MSSEEEKETPKIHTEIIPVIKQENEVVCEAIYSIKHQAKRLKKGQSIKEEDCDKIHKCDQCNNKFPTLLNLVKHIAKDHTGRKCDKCHKRFRSFSTLKNHQIRVHNYNQVCISETYGYKTERWTKLADKEIKVNVTQNLRTYTRSSKPKMVPLEIKEEPELIIPD